MSYVELLNKKGRNPATGKLTEVSFLMLKPGFNNEVYQTLQSLLSRHSLTVESEQDVTLTKTSAVAMFATSILLDMPDDKTFGLDWKNEVIDYLCSGSSKILAVSRANAPVRCRLVRNELRAHYGKILPAKGEKLPREEFSKRVIQNLIHNPDPHETMPFAWIIDTAIDSSFHTTQHK